MDRRQLLLLAVAFEGGLVVLAWGLGAALGTPPFGALHPTGTAVIYGVLAGVPPLVGLAAALRSRWAPLVQLRQTVDDLVAQLFAGCTVLDFVLISALAGLGEEALFRGVLQTALADAVGVWPALALAGILFGLAHFISWPYAVYATVFGVYLGVLLLVFDSLLVPILAHAVYDFVALIYLARLRPPPKNGAGESKSL